MRAALALLGLAAAGCEGLGEQARCLVEGGCQTELRAPGKVAQLDEPFFRCRVQPVVAKSCAFFACHGDGRRFYRIYARNRLRLDKVDLDRNKPLTPTERQANFEFARAFVDPGDVAQSLFLMKPLDRVVADGRYHRGDEIFKGGNVYLTRDDPEWKVLEEWTAGATFDPVCVEPGSEL